MPARGLLAAPPLQNQIEAKHTFKVHYANLRVQRYFTLSSLVARGKVAIGIESPDTRESIIEELEQIKVRDIDKDGKLKVVAKDQIKEHLGSSPDYADALMMRMYFQLDPTPVPRIR
ncbi:MAG: hypothetical protein M3440_05200 [Chloroflexota bacterium]|nr:hypothetical protein [Chloroflexota bacterium]